MSRVALESLYRLLWVYIIRIKCESNTVTQRSVPARTEQAVGPLHTISAWTDTVKWKSSRQHLNHHIEQSKCPHLSFSRTRIRILSTLRTGLVYSLLGEHPPLNNPLILSCFPAAGCSASFQHFSPKVPVVWCRGTRPSTSSSRSSSS